MRFGADRARYLNEHTEISSDLSSQNNHTYRCSSTLSLQRIAYYCRALIADSLRTSSPLNVNCFLAGMDQAAVGFRHRSSSKGPALYRLDNIGHIKRLKYSAHGRQTSFLLSLMDRIHAQKIAKADTALNPDHESLDEVEDGSEKGKKERGLPSRGSEADVCLTHEEGVKLMKQCWHELQHRSAVANLNECSLYCVSARGGVQSLSHVLTGK
jgi:20S proteasome alpha/beta subunit